MESEGFKRKLFAILSADVVGYSRLRGEDDDTTVRTLTGHGGPEIQSQGGPPFMGRYEGIF